MLVTAVVSIVASPGPGVGFTHEDRERVAVFVVLQMEFTAG